MACRVQSKRDKIWVEAVFGTEEADAADAEGAE